jgi:hypothetical protein
MFLSFFILKEGAKKEFNSIHSKEKSLQERCVLPKKMSLVGNKISGEKPKKSLLSILQEYFDGNKLRTR